MATRAAHRAPRRSPVLRALRAAITFPARRRAARKAAEAEYFEWFATLKRTPASF